MMIGNGELHVAMIRASLMSTWFLANHEHNLIELIHRLRAGR